MGLLYLLATWDRNEPLPDGVDIPTTESVPYFGWDTGGRLDKGIDSFQRIVYWFSHDVMGHDFNVFGFTMSFFDVFVLSLLIFIGVMFLIKFFNDFRG